PATAKMATWQPPTRLPPQESDIRRFANPRSYQPLQFDQPVLRRGLSSAQTPALNSLVTASLIAATVVDIGLFKTARHFAAWLGLVPRQFSTGGKTRLGRITKTGNREIRKLLVLGATSMVYRAPQWNSEVGAWTRGVLERRPVRLVTVALANKIARIAWALMTRKDVYRATGRVVAVTEAAA